MFLNLFSWLEDEPSKNKLPAWIIMSCMVFLLYGEVISGMFLYFNWGADGGLGYGENPLKLIFVFDRLQVAAGEEMMFRAFLVLPILLFRKSKLTILLTVATSSYFFGLSHDYGSLYNIAHQGIVGVGLCLVFLKCGAMKGRFFQAIWVTTAIHFLHNMAIAIIGWFFF